MDSSGNNDIASKEIYERLCVAARLVNITTKVECCIIGSTNEIVAEVPANHLEQCFCRRLASITNEESNIDHLFTLCEEAVDPHFIYSCPFGLTNIIVPVIQDNHLVAALQVGPVLTVDPDEILQKHALSRSAMKAEDLQQLKEYLDNLPKGNIDYTIALAEMITMLTIERPLKVKTSDLKVGDIEYRSRQGTCSAVINSALDFIESNFTNDDISLDNVAKSVYVHPSHLSRMFSQHMNCRFRSYINSLRINLAKELLLDTDDSIGEICNSVGFTDQSYFDKIFRQHEDMTPTQYRKRNKPAKNRRPQASSEPFVESLPNEIPHDFTAAEQQPSAVR